MVGLVETGVDRIREAGSRRLSPSAKLLMAACCQMLSKLLQLFLASLAEAVRVKLLGFG